MNFKYRVWTGPTVVRDVASVIAKIPTVTNVIAGTEHVLFESPLFNHNVVEHAHATPDTSPCWPYLRHLRSMNEGSPQMFTVIDDHDGTTVLGPVTQDNAYICAYGSIVEGEKAISRLDVGESTLKRYALSGQRPTVYRVMRVK